MGGKPGRRTTIIEKKTLVRRKYFRPMPLLPLERHNQRTAAAVVTVLA